MVLWLIIQEAILGTSKVAIILDEALAYRLDQMVAQHNFPNRSKAIQIAVEGQLIRLD